METTENGNIITTDVHGNPRLIPPETTDVLNVITLPEEFKTRKEWYSYIENTVRNFIFNNDIIIKFVEEQREYNAELLRRISILEQQTTPLVYSITPPLAENIVISANVNPVDEQGEKQSKLGNASETPKEAI